MLTIEHRHFIVSGRNKASDRVIQRSGKYWHVEKEDICIPMLNNRPGYVLKSLRSGEVILVRKINSEVFNLEKEYFTETEVSEGNFPRPHSEDYI